uniref:Oxidoreductase molybdopterin-binding domain-containing protein n=1 Tax=Guillardia theta TaxID=55529 RepID=A0A7S4L1M5_GUITH|mmetsp:Transcript_35696/g.111678  ORF Transcript_35696/g.111678 Transcript_35696/m.111678 type:complete len:444 (+) Transcript_35696:50-1381(+)
MDALDIEVLPPPSWLDPWRRAGGLWRLRICCNGLVLQTLRLSQIERLGLRRYELVWHHALLASTLRTEVQGVALADLLKTLEPADSWRFMYQLSGNGYTTVTDREDMQDAFIAVRDIKGNLLDRDMGGVRIVFPGLYSWKSAKFVTEISLDDCYRPGLWEGLGFHRRGRWACEEIFQGGRASPWQFLLAAMRSCFTLFGKSLFPGVLAAALRGIARLKILLDPPRPQAHQPATKQVAVKAAARENVQLPGRELGYSYVLGHLPDCPSKTEELQAGDSVFVLHSRRKKMRMRGVVAAFGPGRVMVRIKDEIVQCWRSEVEKLLQGMTVLVVPETHHYHYLAYSQVVEGDKALEIGSDFGRCSVILARACGDAVGVDVMPERVAQAQATFGSPNLKFITLDCLKETEKLADIGRGRNKVFIDINGNRCSSRSSQRRFPNSGCVRR